MPGSADPSRIFRDPALTDRRGDPTGPVALLFLATLVGAFALGAVILISLPPVVADPTPRPSVSPSVAPTPRPSATPAPSPSDAPAPSPSDAPDPSVSPTAIPSAATGGIGDQLPLVVDGRRVGSVTVRSPRAGELPERTPPPGVRIVVVPVRYEAAAALAYDAADWEAIDAEGRRYASLGGEAPPEALGSGRLAAGGAAVGNVAFERPNGTQFRAFVLTDGAGRDLVVVERGGGS